MPTNASLVSISRMVLIACRNVRLRNIQQAMVRVNFVTPVAIRTTVALVRSLFLATMAATCARIPYSIGLIRQELRPMTLRRDGNLGSASKTRATVPMVSTSLVFPSISKLRQGLPSAPWLVRPHKILYLASLKPGNSRSRFEQTKKKPVLCVFTDKAF